MNAARPIPMLTLLAGAIALTACAAFQPASIEPEPEPLVAGVSAGLEVHRWVVDDRDHAVARALVRFENRPVPIDNATLERLRENGIRVLACRPSESEELLAALRPVAPVQRQWFGMLNQWTELVAGPELPTGVHVTTDTGVIELAPGRLRLLARCWEVLAEEQPDGAPPAAALRIELIPQHKIARRIDPLRTLFEQERTIADEGLTFSRLRATWTSSTDQPLIIVAEADHVDWNDLPEPYRPLPPLTEPGPDPEANIPAATIAPIRSADSVFGPKPPKPPTIGELMLIGRDLTESAVRAKVVLVLIPRSHRVFELAPGRSPSLP